MDNTGRSCSGPALVAAKGAKNYTLETDGKRKGHTYFFLLLKNLAEADPNHF